jgi:hypothetical protein
MKLIEKYLNKSKKNFDIERKASQMFNDINDAIKPIINKHRKEMQDNLQSSEIPDLFQKLGEHMFHFWKGFTGKDAWRKFK